MICRYKDPVIGRVFKLRGHVRVPGGYASGSGRVFRQFHGSDGGHHLMLACQSGAEVTVWRDQLFMRQDVTFEIRGGLAIGETIWVRSGGGTRLEDFDVFRAKCLSVVSYDEAGGEFSRRRSVVKNAVLIKQDSGNEFLVDPIDCFCTEESANTTILSGLIADTSRSLTRKRKTEVELTHRLRGLQLKMASLL